MTQIHDNIKNLQAKIYKAATLSGRNPDHIHLMAVSKRQSQDHILAALRAGQFLFGENKVQEAQDHWSVLKKTYSKLRLHMIGNLQTNKVQDAVALFDCLETIDRPKLARKVGEVMKECDRNIPCLIQVNTGSEPQKAGVLPQEFSDFYEYCRHDCQLTIRGLMCIPPAKEPPALHFALLRTLAQKYHLPDLSMGMSSDFEKAIPLGATYIRIGTALFGARNV